MAYNGNDKRPGFWDAGGIYEQALALWSEKYFLPDTEKDWGLICDVCGALVGDGWKHINFHEGKDVMEGQG